MDNLIKTIKENTSDFVWYGLDGPVRITFMGSDTSGHHGHAGRPGSVGGSAPSFDTVAIRAYDAVRNKGGSLNDKYNQYSGDPTYAELAKQLGYDGKPSIATKEELNELIANGGTELFRGFSSQEYQDQFIDGEFFGSNGVWGAGIYFGHGPTGEQTAALYSIAGKPLRAVLSKGAKIGQWGDLRKEMENELNGRRKELHKLGMGSEEGWAKSKGIKSIYEDVGRFAALKGYDAFIGNNREFIVLNRGALVVER